MPGDDKSDPPPPPPTMEGLAAPMTKLLSSMGDMEVRMEARLTLLELRFAAAFPSFTAPSPMPPQQHGEGIFYGGVDGTQAVAPPLPAAVALLQLGKKKRLRGRMPAMCLLRCGCRLQHAAS